MIIEIVEFLRSHGVRMTNSMVIRIYEYLYYMMKDGRLITFRDNDKLIGFATFSMCDNTDHLYLKDLWEYVPHDPEGLGCYIEMIVSRRWDKKLRTAFEQAIANRFPDFEYGIWHRPGQNADRILIVRRQNVSSENSKQ